MIVKMKRYEKEAVDYAKTRFPKGSQWDSHIITKDGFLEGYKKALELVEYNGIIVIDNGQEEVEVDFPDGSHQLVGK